MQTQTQQNITGGPGLPAISGHAVARFRERCPGAARDQSDGAVAQGIATAVARAVQAGRYEDLLDEGRATRVVEFMRVADNGADMFAIVRVSNDAPAGKTLDDIAYGVVVTVLDRERRDQASASKWLRPPKLGDVVPPEVQAAVTHATSLAAVAPRTSPGDYFIHYRAGDEWQTAFAADRADLNRVLDTLAEDGVSPDGVVVSRRVRTRLRLVLEEE